MSAVPRLHTTPARHANGAAPTLAIIGKRTSNGTDFPFFTTLKFSLHLPRGSPNLGDERDRRAAFSRLFRSTP
jgi:hypothetical protein